MAFEDSVVILAGLVLVDLPDTTLRLCDGGFVDWPGEGVFRSEDAVFGTIESVESIAEAIGDEAPAGKLTLLPKDTAEAGDLFQSDAQGRPVRFWFAEVDKATSTVIGTPELVFDGLIDFMTVRLAKGSRRVEIDFIAAAERLFFIREGNVLSSRFHQLAWPGEKGFDHCTGAQVAVPWGVPGPGRGTTNVASGQGGDVLNSGGRRG